MSRLDAALAELVAAIRDELADDRAGGGPPELLSVQEAARRLGVSRTTAYSAIGRGELRSVKIGARRLVPADALAELAQRGTVPPTNGTARGSNREATTIDRRIAV